MSQVLLTTTMFSRFLNLFSFKRSLALSKKRRRKKSLMKNNKKYLHDCYYIKLSMAYVFRKAVHTCFSCLEFSEYSYLLQEKHSRCKCTFFFFLITNLCKTNRDSLSMPSFLALGIGWSDFTYISDLFNGYWFVFQIRLFCIWLCRTMFSQLYNQQLLVTSHFKLEHISKLTFCNTVTRKINTAIKEIREYIYSGFYKINNPV